MLSILSGNFFSFQSISNLIEWILLHQSQTHLFLLHQVHRLLCQRHITNCLQIIIIIISSLNCYVQNSNLRSNLVIDVGDKIFFGYQQICSQIHQIHTRIFINFIRFFIWDWCCSTLGNGMTSIELFVKKSYCKLEQCCIWIARYDGCFGSSKKSQKTSKLSSPWWLLDYEQNDQKPSKRLKTMMVVGLVAKELKHKQTLNTMMVVGLAAKKSWKTSKFFEVYLSSCLWQLWQHAWMSPSLGSQPTTTSWDSRTLSCGVFCVFWVLWINQVSVACAPTHPIWCEIHRRTCSIGSFLGGFQW